ncbi:MAG: LPXTG cell wall anchor domain-containing protein, partial [Clostridium sp.]|nr:LPXTG cell wall anchor domain-containing protein [Clostridium sp.]
RKFIFNFPSEVSSPYLLTFRTNVVDKSKSPFTKKVNFKGEKTSENSTSDPVKVEFQSGGGGAVGTRGTITVNKVDKDKNNIKLKGAKFILLDRYKNKISSGETDDNGSLTFNKIKFDIPYYLQEVDPPQGYVSDETQHEFMIKSSDDSKNIEYTIENTIIKANLELKKLDKNSNLLKGAEFTIYDSFDKEVAKATTDENGIAKFENLVYGNYYYVETKAPEGYLLKNDKHDFTINENGITLKETIVNERILGNIKAFKIDEDNKFLANAELTLFDSQGNEVQSLVTNENGEVTFENIPYGDYEVKETKAPEGYNISEEILKVSVNGEESGLVYEAGKITNTKIKADIKINKLDQDGNKVIGVEFTLYNNADEVIETAVTNEDGIAVFKDVVYGNYYIKETKTPEGYIGTDEKIEVSVKENNSVYSYEIENTRIKGTVEIKKVDENGNPLKGAEFTLYNKEGKEISKSISDENGIVRFEAVDYGKYILKETKSPEGYIKDDTEVEVVIDSSKTQVFTFKNVKMKEAVNNGNIDNNNSLGKGNLPSTGDVFDIRLFILVGLALIVVGCGLLFKKKLKLNK